MNEVRQMVKTSPHIAVKRLANRHVLIPTVKPRLKQPLLQRKQHLDDSEQMTSMAHHWERDAPKTRWVVILEVLIYPVHWSLHGLPCDTLDCISIWVWASVGSPWRSQQITTKHGFPHPSPYLYTHTCVRNKTHVVIMQICPGCVMLTLRSIYAYHLAISLNMAVEKILQTKQN